MSKRKQTFTPEEALAQIFADQDSDDEDIECGDESLDANEEFESDDGLDPVGENASNTADGNVEYENEEEDSHEIRIDGEATQGADDLAGNVDPPLQRPINPLRQRNRRPVQIQPEWNWKKDAGPDTFTPNNVNFQKQERILGQLPDHPSPLDYFTMYISEEIIGHIVTETNRYANQYITANSENLRPHSNIHNWSPTNFAEMSTFLAVIILMGVVFKPRMYMYWSNDDIYSTPIFGQVLSRDRFMLLLRFLHFANNENYDANDEQRDRLFKIRPLVDLIKRQLQRNYYPERDLCVDESLVLFKGRLSFKQFIRSKRARFGIKFYEICTSKGILLDFLIYYGNMYNELVHENGFLTTERIVLTLLQPYLNQGHRLFIDNFYSTPKLAKYLLDNNTIMVGTIRPNRKQFCKEIVNTDLQKGSCIAFSSQGVLSVKYRSHANKSDNKPKIVYMISTGHTSAMANTGKNDRHGAAVLKPQCVIDYNKKMGGVDIADQQLNSLNVLRKTYKWYKKVGLRLILQCLLSSHKLYQSQGGSNDFLGYTHSVITQLLSRSPRLNKGVVSRAPDTIQRLTGRNHFPTKRTYDGQGDKRKSKSKNCRVCYARGLMTPSGHYLETTWVCQGCPGLPGLHVEKECFRIYHTMFDYSY